MGNTLSHTVYGQTYLFMALSTTRGWIQSACPVPVQALIQHQEVFQARARAPRANRFPHMLYSNAQVQSNEQAEQSS